MGDAPDAKKARTDDPYADWQSARDPDTDKVYYYNAKTQATCWEWPPPVSVPAGSGGDFEPSPTYTGVRKGYVFKLGAHGQGYYKDAPPNVAPPEEPVLDFAPRPGGNLARRSWLCYSLHGGTTPVVQRCTKSWQTFLVEVWSSQGTVADVHGRAQGHGLPPRRPGPGLLPRQPVRRQEGRRALREI